jgi:hypothetical protein
LRIEASWLYTENHAALKTAVKARIRNPRGFHIIAAVRRTSFINKRDDAKTPSQIDAVFERSSRTGREKQSGKPLLFTYLR